MRICSKCGNTYDNEVEMSNSRKKLYYLCPKCYSQRNMEEKKRYFERYPEKKREQSKRAEMRKREKIKALKPKAKDGFQFCRKCGKELPLECFENKGKLKTCKICRGQKFYTLDEYKASLHRTCKRCGEYLPLDNFDGKRRICLKCADKPISGYDVTKYSEKKRCQVHRYEAKKKGLIADFTYTDWLKVKETFNNKCAYCGVEHVLSQDHFIPLSKGGGYTRNNIIPVCHMCNSSKRNLDFFEWYPQQEFYSKDREEKILNYLNYHDHFQQLMLG